MNLPKWFREKKVRDGMWLAVAAVIAIQIYYVREMLAALLIFGVLFASGTIVVVALLLLDQASQRAAALAESQAKRAAQAARRGLAHVEELGKKLPHRTIPAK